MVWTGLHEFPDYSGMTSPALHTRSADHADATAVARLAAELSGRALDPSVPSTFETSFAAVLADDDARLLVAVRGSEIVGYLLGFWHVTFFANGPVGVVEEILVLSEHRQLGIGRALMDAFEQWSAKRGCALVCLSTRRAVPFYRALGYEESATYLRKPL
jgi:GNAT superfamily N-acetyltransferase